MGMDPKTQEALNTIHKGNHMILREIGRICEKYHIQYFLDSGNLIGAVRHKSDIPWDDDADIAMTRKDFEVFRRVAKKELKKNFAYVEPHELGGAFYDFVPRVVLLNSSIREKNEREQFYGKGIYNHMFVDFFILDDVSDRAWRHKLTHGLLLIVYGLAMGRRYRLDLSEYQGFSKIVVAILSVVGRVIPVKTLVRWYDKIGMSESGDNKKNHQYFYHNCLVPDLGKTFDADWYREAVMLPVDDELFPCPCGYDAILKKLYGDYMQLPPEEKRTASHCQPENIQLFEPEAEGTEDTTR